MNRAIIGGQGFFVMDKGKLVMQGNPKGSFFTCEKLKIVWP